MDTLEHLERVLEVLLGISGIFTQQIYSKDYIFDLEEKHSTFSSFFWSTKIFLSFQWIPGIPLKTERKFFSTKNQRNFFENNIMFSSKIKNNCSKTYEDGDFGIRLRGGH